FVFDDDFVERVAKATGLGGWQIHHAAKKLIAAGLVRDLGANLLEAPKLDPERVAEKIATMTASLRRKSVTAENAAARTAIANPSRTHCPAVSTLTTRPGTSTWAWPAKLTLSQFAINAAPAESEVTTWRASKMLSATSALAQPTPLVVAGALAP